jgi:AbrB family looped-hinge helix DNA binding protein
MPIMKITERGQISIPTAMRKKLGMKPHSKVDVQLRGDEVVVRPIHSIREVYGALHKYTEGVTLSWEEIRTQTEEIIAREVVSE